MKNQKFQPKEAFRNSHRIPGERMSAFEIELPGEPGEYEYFEIMVSEDYLFIANYDGSNFEAYMERDNCFSLDENLQTLYEFILGKLEAGEEIEGELH